MPLKLYISSISSNLETKKHIQKMQMTLDGKHIPYETIDVARQQGALKQMRELMGDDKALVPQIFKDDKHLGGFDEFMQAIEDEQLSEFLGL
ncbi:hypothetical protein PTSG_08686 [Salpingoeca rosetta]|uniref:Uncharacterized protein n=1 Tax=Salpingoeca rosetta (strain ATCC 50818 / BSB-021) TaxID=946362 RepID=F2UKE0_SALR5|nr:uncharacterized protein PTSG_08686 [Salpingoeca rosetta]EGD77589.1 hypothetical protein PTSG_08686 [Salpingoeca rosetta]|eukprot:XP_004990477.1 hypothetical protein PTSG_08686 [Salpingoeca rosetta]